MHCWPQPAAGVREVARVLREGGVFSASTVALPAPAEGASAPPRRRPPSVDGVSGEHASGRPFSDVDELLACFEGAGFSSVSVDAIDKAYVRITAVR